MKKLNEVLIGGYYKHYKNKNYKIIDRAKHSEDLGWYIVYQTKYANELAKIWIRPESMFLEQIEIHDKNVNRFQMMPPTLWPQVFQVFHAHIYFDQSTKAKAEEFLLKIKNQDQFKQKIQTSGLHTSPIGPHPVGMFEVDFRLDLFTEMIYFLMENRNGLNILIHPLSGNGLLDHTEHAMFLGEKADLNLGMF